jgi:UDP-3-O-[3-hydroxymyristoyl] glucosamine N-acyltransferase
VGKGARIAAQAGVIGDVPDGATYSGYPARPHREALRASASLFRLPELRRRVRELERLAGTGDEGQGSDGDPGRDGAGTRTAGGATEDG